MEEFSGGDGAGRSTSIFRNSCTIRMMFIGLKFVIMIRWFNLMNSSSLNFKYWGVQSPFWLAWR